jgi:hypothetical protein
VVLVHSICGRFSITLWAFIFLAGWYRLQRTTILIQVHALKAANHLAALLLSTESLRACYSSQQNHPRVPSSLCFSRPRPLHTAVARSCHLPLTLLLFFYSSGQAAQRLKPCSPGRNGQAA